jgi:hypothetical protein
MRGALAVGLVGIGLAVPAAANAAEAHDFAVGAGNNQFALGLVGDASFTLSAHSDAFGVSPGGYVTAKGDPDGAGPLEAFTAHGEVTCLRVSGNRASLKWRFEYATGSAAPFVGGGVQSFVEDNGEPRFGQPVDRAALDPPQPAAAFNAAADTCDDPSTRATYDVLEQGNIEVHDATG